MEQTNPHLSGRVTHTENAAVHHIDPGRNLPLAIGIALILLTWIIGSLLWWNWGFVIFLMVSSVFGAYELIGALSRTGAYALYVPILVGSPLTIGASYAASTLWGQMAGIAVVLAGLSLTVVACMGMRLRGEVKGYLTDVAASVFVVGYIPALLSTLCLLLAHDDGNLRVMLFFILIACCDTAAYATGVLVGSHKMAPQISPGKTWEGFAGGIVITTIVGALVASAMLDTQWWAGAIVGLVVAVAAVVGDLTESMIKRSVGIKDMGKVLPGHGGAMDRLDSVLIAAPWAWLAMVVLF